MPELTTTTLGRFCREVAGGLDEIDTLLQEWELHPADFEAIKQTPAFKHEMAVVLQEMQELGNDAGYVYRMKSLAEDLLPDVVKMAKAADTTVSQKFEIIRWVTEMARLKEKPAKVAAEGPRGPSVIFQFGAGLPISTMKVIGMAEEEPRLEVAPKLSDAGEWMGSVMSPPDGLEGFS